MLAPRNQKNQKKHYDTRNKEEGLAKISLELDYVTYSLVLKLAEVAGYEIILDVKSKSEKMNPTGIRGVISQAIVDLYKRYYSENNEESNEESYLDKPDVLNKVSQQAYIFTNRIKAMKQIGIDEETIFDTMKMKLPDYLDINDELEITKKDSVKPVKFPQVEIPELSEDMVKDLEFKKVQKFYDLPKKVVKAKSPLPKKAVPLKKKADKPVKSSSHKRKKT